MAIELKLGAKDLAQYGGPEWLPFDPDALADLDYDELYKLEMPMRLDDGLTLALMLTSEWSVKSLRGIRGAFWVARQLAGLTKPDYADFKPNAVACDWRDATPPADGSSEPSSES